MCVGRAVGGGLGGLDAGDGDAVPVRGGRLIAGMEEAHVAEEAGEGDDVLQPPGGQGPGGLVAGAGLAEDLQKHPMRV